MTSQEFWNTPIEQLVNLPLNRKVFEQFEVLDLLSIKPYQLRFWESEFDCIKGNKEQYTNHYTLDDLKILIRIKKYLMEDQLTIEKAKALIDLELKNSNSNTTNTELTSAIVVNNSHQINDEINLVNSQKELSDSLSACAVIENIEESMNMNALYEEMSLETFQNSEENTNVQNNSANRESMQVKIIKKINEIREKLKNW
jgi:DNA-binding transcriptional MerR regulator